MDEPVIVTPECQGRERGIDNHKNDGSPHKYFADLLWDAFNPARKDRIKHFQPDNGGDPPEKAEQQVDASAQVKRDLAVIPEDSAEYEFCKNAANIFVCSAKKRPIDENISVIFIFILI